MLVCSLVGICKKQDRWKVTFVTTLSISLQFGSLSENFFPFPKETFTASLYKLWKVLEI